MTSQFLMAATASPESLNGGGGGGGGGMHCISCKKGSSSA